MSFLTIVNLVIFTGLLSFIFQLNKKKMSLSKQVLLGLFIGTIFGAYLQIFFGAENRVSQETIEWTNIVANSFVNLLRMIIIPLILVTMIAAVLKVDEIKSKTVYMAQKRRDMDDALRRMGDLEFVQFESGPEGLREVKLNRTLAQEVEKARDQFGFNDKASAMNDRVRTAALIRRYKQELSQQEKDLFDMLYIGTYS